jgi:hypothetical protein
VAIVKSENEQAEIARLRQDQAKARMNEVYGGFTEAEKAQYDHRANLICELQRRILDRGQNPGRKGDSGLRSSTALVPLFYPAVFPSSDMPASWS